MGRRYHSTLPQKKFKLFWEQRELFAVDDPDDLVAQAAQQELLEQQAAQEQEDWAKKTASDKRSPREMNPISGESMENVNQGLWFKMSERTSGVFKEVYVWELTDWIDPVKKERKEFSNFTEYLKADIWEHAVASGAFWAFFDKEGARMPLAMKTYFNEYFESSQGTDEYEKLQTKISNSKDSYWNQKMYEAFAKAIKNAKITKYEDTKKHFSWHFDSHVSTMKNNASVYIKEVKTKATEKFLTLEWRFPNSNIAKWLHNDLELNLKKLDWMYDDMWSELSAKSLIDWVDKTRQDEFYHREVLEWLRKHGLIQQDEQWACFKKVEKDGKTVHKLSIKKVKKLLDKLRSEYDNKDEKWRYWYEAIWDIQFYSYKKAVSGVSREYYQKYLDKIDKIESDIDYTLTQYDEYINIWNEIWEKTREDCLKELELLPTGTFWKREIHDMMAALDEWFHGARDAIHNLRRKWNITDDQRNLMFDRLNASIDFTKDDPLFWSIVWKDLNTVSDGFYKVFMNKGEEEEFDNADDGDKKKIKAKSALQTVKEMDHDQINKLFDDLLWAWEIRVWEDNQWNFWKSEKILQKHKGKKGCKDFIIHLDDLKDRVIEAKESNVWLSEQYKEINDKPEEKQTGFDKKRLESIQRAMQANAEVAAEGDLITKYIISNLDWWEEEHTEIYFLSLKDIFNAVKNAKEYWNEVFESRSKKTWHQLAWDVTKYIPWMQQLSSSELAKVSQEFNTQVEKWKEGFKTLDRKWVYNELLKNIKSKKGRYEKDHLQAVIDTLSDKWALQIVDNNLVKALNNHLPHWMKINMWHYIDSLDMWEKEAVLRSKFNYIFWDNELAQKVIKQNDSNIKTKTEEARSEYDRLWDAAWWRFERIYKNYLQMWYQSKPPSFNDQWQLIPGMIVNFWDSDQVDSAAYEQSLFFALEEFTMDPREALFYIVRWYATGLIPQNRLGEIEARGLYSKISFLQGLRWKPISYFRELDLLLTNDWKDPNAVSGWEMTPEIKDRVALLIRKLTDEDGWNRTDRNLQQADAVDPDLWRDIIWKASFAEFQSQIFWSTAWWRVKFKGQAWSAVTVWMTDEFETFWKHYATWKIDKVQQDNQADNMKETLKLWMALDAAKYSWTYQDSTKWSDVNKLSTKLAGAPPKISGPWVTLTNSDYASVLRNLTKDILGWVSWWNSVLTKIYDKPSKNYIEWNIKYLEDWEPRYTDEFDEVMGTPEAKARMIEVIEQYQNNWWIPTCWDNKDGQAWLDIWGLGWHKNN